MKLIQQTKLHFQDTKSDKVYEVDLYEVGDATYLVNFRYGRRGQQLREGTKTDLPVALETAEKIFEKLVNDKKKKGYQDISEPFVAVETEVENLSKEEKDEEAEQNELPQNQYEFPAIRKNHILKSIKEYVQAEQKNPQIEKNTTNDTPHTSIPSEEKNETPSSTLDTIFNRFKSWINPEDEKLQPRQEGNSRNTSPQKDSKKEKEQRPLSRLLWRVGEFRIQEAVPYLVKMEIGANPLFNYCFAWAIGRCGDAAGLPKLEEMGKQAKDYPFLKEFLREAKMACLSEVAKKEIASEILQSQSPFVRTAVKNESVNELLQFIDDSFGKSKTANEIMSYLYLISNHYPIIRKSLLVWVKQAPLKGSGYFRTFRQFFKAAEFREDAEMYGLLAYRIQNGRPLFDNASWGAANVDGRWIYARDEVKKKDSRMGFSKKTKTYLERRSWRILNRKGEVGDPSYVKMATGILLAFSDEDLDTPRSKDFWNYFLGDNGRWVSERKTLHYSPLTRYWALNNILYKNSPRYEINNGKNKWLFKDGYSSKSQKPNEREEAYPELWDKMPQGILHLLAESESSFVQEFAVKAAKDNQKKILNLINIDFVNILLQKRYEDTARFGLTLAKQKYKANEPDIELINTLLNVKLPEARRQGIAWVDEQRNHFLNEVDFVIGLLFNSFEDVNIWADELLSAATFSKEKSQIIIARAIALIMSYDEKANEEEKQKILTAGSFVTKHFQKTLSTTSFDLLHDLFNHPLVEVQVFGAKILLNHETKVEDLPEDLLLGLINGTSPEMREAGVQLFGKLPTEKLLERKVLLQALSISKYPEVRKSSQPIIIDLAKKHPEFGDEFVQLLAPSFLKKEENEGRDQDVLELLTVHLKSHLHKISLANTLDLLYAPRKAAHVLGNHLLQNHTNQKDMTMRQIVRLGDNEMVAVRQWVENIYEKNIDRIQNELAEAVRLTDARWDDIRDYSFDFFREKIGEEHWSPEILVSLCDSVKPVVQQFGKELITRFFKEENGEQFLLQLSQHPTQELQFFATNYLERFATDKPEHIEKLKHYFITVLSGVNKSRVAKKRIFEFLKNEGMKREGTAKIVAEVLERQSGTMAIGDKARCIQIMRDLQAHFEGLKVPVEKIEFEDYPIS